MNTPPNGLTFDQVIALLQETKANLPAHARANPVVVGHSGARPSWGSVHAVQVIAVRAVIDLDAGRISIVTEPTLGAPMESQTVDMEEHEKLRRLVYWDLPCVLGDQSLLPEAKVTRFTDLLGSVWDPKERA